MLSTTRAQAARLAPSLPVRIALAIAAGLPGIASLASILPAIPGVPSALLLLNPLLMLIVLAGLGAFAQARLPFRVRLFARTGGRRLPLAPPGARGLAAAGIGFGFVLALADHAARHLWQTSAALPSIIEGWSVHGLLVGVFYGGVTEEILMRLGLVSLVVLVLWRLFARAEARPPRWAVIAGVVVAAAIFALGHVPVALGSGAEPSAALVARVLLLNGVAGLVFGWLYVSRDLETAMVVHAAAHVGFALAALAVG